MPTPELRWTGGIHITFYFLTLSCCDEDTSWHNLSSESQIIWICFTYPSGKESREGVFEIMRPFTHNILSITFKVHQSDFLFYCQWNQLATARGVLLLLWVTLYTGHGSVVSCESLRSKAETIFSPGEAFSSVFVSFSNLKKGFDHLHRSWSCPKLSLFWPWIFDTLGRGLGVPLDPDPLTVSSIPNIPNSSKRVIAFTTLFARRLILLKWIHPTRPTHLRGSLKFFNITWQPSFTVCGEQDNWMNSEQNPPTHTLSPMTLDVSMCVCACVWGQEWKRRDAVMVGEGIVGFL